MSNIKIATWNLCLGLKSKKDYVSKVIIDENIDICCLQETDLEPNYPTNLLSFNGYELLSENNEYKSRAAIYIKQGIPFTRRPELEGVNNGLVIIDLILKTNYRIINLYRSFNPPNSTEKEFFNKQLELILL